MGREKNQLTIFSTLKIKSILVNSVINDKGVLLSHWKAILDEQQTFMKLILFRLKIKAENINIFDNIDRPKLNPALA